MCRARRLKALCFYLALENEPIRIERTRIDFLPPPLPLPPFLFVIYLFLKILPNDLII